MAVDFDGYQAHPGSDPNRHDQQDNADRSDHAMSQQNRDPADRKREYEFHRPARDPTTDRIGAPANCPTDAHEQRDPVDVQEAEPTRWCRQIGQRYPQQRLNKVGQQPQQRSPGSYFEEAH